MKQKEKHAKTAFSHESTKIQPNSESARKQENLCLRNVIAGIGLQRSSREWEQSKEDRKYW